ncbi:hypothetical protein L4D20_13415 [Vibrio kyushuensis]|uniref:hypothetical protein n=1 Tax=Vibrio TaxID=662 RepID=UPI003D10F14A
MNKLIAVLAMFTVSITPIASAETIDTNDIDRLFNQASVDAVISMAYQTKSARYTDFAQLFNLCQKRPQDERCGDEYKTKRTNYEVAKSNHGALVMVNTPEFQSLFMPEVNYPEFVGSLKALGYLDSDLESSKTNQINQEQLLVALNRWLDSNGFEQTSEIYFMHALLVRAQELSQQLES